MSTTSPSLHGRDDIGPPAKPSETGWWACELYCLCCTMLTTVQLEIIIGKLPMPLHPDSQHTQARRHEVRDHTGAKRSPHLHSKVCTSLGCCSQTVAVPIIPAEINPELSIPTATCVNAYDIYSWSGDGGIPESEEDLLGM